MKISKSSTIIIPGEMLKENKIYNVSTVLKSSDNILIKGKVNNPDGMPAEEACVEIVEVSIVETIKGYVFTNENGEFAFSVKYKANVDYKLNIYSSIEN